jgi:hypothetical protein
MASLAVHEKRSESVSVRLTASDLEKFKKAAGILWPGAVLSQSGIVLGLARMAAEAVLLKKKPKT